MSSVPEHVLIIAEAGVNHNGDLEMAKCLVDAAVEAGADIVKFQTFKSELLIAPNATKAAYQEKSTGSGESQLEMVRKLELDRHAHAVLLEHCKKRGISFLSTPFDAESIVLLKEMGITIGKIPSGEVTNKSYLQAMAMAFPDLIMSTGMCSMHEVEEAMAVLEASGATRERITLLHCNTEYPTPMRDVNLRAMRTLADVFHTAVGYSDHTEGIEVPIAAVAMGASVIEKHFTLDRDLPGPDHRASLEPAELKAMVQGIRRITDALGTGIKAPSPSEQPNIAIARKSIHLRKAVAKGTALSSDDLIMLRPGDGISPMRVDEIIGRIVSGDLPSGHKLHWSELS